MTSELLKLLLAAVAQLTALQARLGIVGMEMAAASIARSFDPARTPDERADAEVAAAAAAIKAKMTADRDLGFASLIRTDFPDRIILEMAEAALQAARDARNEPPSKA